MFPIYFLEIVENKVLNIIRLTEKTNKKLSFR